MKIFYKKDYEEQLRTTESLSIRNQKLSVELKKEKETNELLSQRFSIKKAENTKLEEKVKELKVEIKKLISEKDDLSQELQNSMEIIENLKGDLKQAQERIKELESDRYKVVKVRACSPSKQEMGIKSSKVKSRKSEVNKKLKEISENNLKVG